MSTTPNIIGHPFLQLRTVDSTNNYATALVHAGMAQHGLAVLAHEQTKGKGQRNKQWRSEAGQNIALSLVLQPPGLAPSQLFLLSMAVALGSFRFVKSVAGSETTIKWPNDLYWRDRKAGGILIENILQGSQWRFAVAGIGLNVNQTAFDPSYGRAVSLRQITGRSFDVVEAARQLCAEVDTAFRQLAEGATDMVAAYNEQLFRRGQAVRFRREGRVFEATVERVDATGRLWVRHAVEEAFEVGDVEWVLGEGN